MPDRKIRVMIAEDDTALRRSLVEHLNLEEDLVVVSNVGNGAQALAEAGVLKPDVILTDIDMPQVTGIELTREIRKLLPDLAVVVLTKFGDDDNVFSAIKAGAIGYVLKDSGFSEIAGAVRMAVNGEGFLSPAIVGKVLFEFKRLSKSALHNRQAFAELSRREVEVLECIAAGMKNAAIADKLFLSEKTVKSHVGSILKKLHVNDRAEAAALAQQSGVI
jgi:DNA-binding NarL/FixJ family response regulator